MVKINMNEYMYIIPKEEDFKKMKKRDDEILPQKYRRDLSDYKSRVNENGFLRFQIHDFMNYFGDTAYPGGFLPGKDGCMYFDEVKELGKDIEGII